jgi:hypothetical protein
MTGIPGFTAEVSLYKTSEHYQVAASESAGDGDAAFCPDVRPTAEPFGPSAEYL